MAHYPLFVDLAGRPVLVVGGGAVAERKVEGLLAAGAAVTVVAPEATEAIARHAGSGRIAWERRGYRAGDVEGRALVFVATDDAAVTLAVAAEARARGVWVNAADDPDHCDFVLPSVFRRGALVVAVSTGGVSPALARAVRERLEAVLPREYEALAEVVGEVRRELRSRAPGPDADAWRRALADDDLRDLVAQGRPEEARRRLLARLGAA